MFAHLEKHFWKTIIDTMSEGLMVVDPIGQIIFVNQSFEKLLGYTWDELRGKTCEIFRCDRCFSAREEGVDKYCALFKEDVKEQFRSSECVFQKKDGAPLQLLKNAAVITNQQGKIIGGVETLTDLSNIRAQEKVISELRKQLFLHEEFHGITGNSPVMLRTYEMISSAARSDAPIIIYGESGTGKELLAAAAHQLSKRNQEPFIKVNCAALNDNLLESELFGHVKGAFTGANTDRTGRFEAAHNGTIFLDEIGDLPLTTQTKLLRVLQEKEIERVGDHRPIAINVRVLTATNKDLQKLIYDKLFREDLYYRISVIPVTLPPLRERLSDLPLLVEVFLSRISRRSGKNIHSISSAAMDCLAAYSWPGNIRELINVLEYTFVQCSDDSIQVDHLPPYLRQSTLTDRGTALPAIGEIAYFRKPERKIQVLSALNEARGNKTEAAKNLGISRVTLWKWCKKFHIDSRYASHDGKENNEV